MGKLINKTSVQSELIREKQVEELYKQTFKPDPLTIIAYNNNGYIISIVLAKSLELAHAYWSGQKLEVHNTAIVGVDIVMMEENLGGVVPLLKTRQTNFINPEVKPIIVIK